MCGMLFVMYGSSVFSIVFLLSLREVRWVCMTYSLLMLVEDAIGDHTEEAYSRAGLITAL